MYPGDRARGGGPNAMPALVIVVSALVIAMVGLVAFLLTRDGRGHAPAAGPTSSTTGTTSPGSSTARTGTSTRTSTSTSGTTTAPSRSTSSTSPTPTTAPTNPAELPAGTDVRGHLTPGAARCDVADAAEVIGATATHTFVICDAGGSMYYRGSDGAGGTIEAPATATATGYEARAGNTTYSVRRDALGVETPGTSREDRVTTYWHAP